MITLKQATKLTPYSAEYLRLRARQGKLKAVKLGRDWFTTEKDIKKYMKKVKKHWLKMQSKFKEFKG